MKNEIKEITDYLKISNKNKFGFEQDKIISYKEAQILLDYITNLQEENERLKEENKRIFSKVNDDELLISNAMNYAEAQEYKSRCEKAIEYMNNYIELEDAPINERIKIEFKEVIKLLNGGDEE